MKHTFLKKNQSKHFHNLVQNKTNKKKNENNLKGIELKNNQILLAGKHCVLSALQNRNRKIHFLITTAENLPKWKEETSKLKVDVIVKSKDEMDTINKYKPHQNILLIAAPLKRLSMDEFLLNNNLSKNNHVRLLILDQVTDPQNVGAIVRSALAFKMDGVALSQRNSPQETSALNRASSGAIDKLQIIELSNMSREIQKLRKNNFSVYGLDSEGKKNVYDLENETGNIALILGSEGRGLRRLTKEKVDSLIKIPINVKSDSLNVSNAASVAMFQLQKNITKN